MWETVPTQQPGRNIYIYIYIYIFQFSWSPSQIHSNKSKREHAWTVCDAASFGGDEPSSEKIFLHTINTSGKC